MWAGEQTLEGTRCQLFRALDYMSTHIAGPCGCRCRGRWRWRRSGACPYKDDGLLLGSRRGEVSIPSKQVAKGRHTRRGSERDGGQDEEKD